LEDVDHRGCVNRWLGPVAEGRSVTQLIDTLERGFSALWLRAYLTLGEVTLVAIVKRVLWSAEEKFAFLSKLDVDETGLRCDELRKSADTLGAAQVVESIRFVLVELLTVIGNLTADILTPPLHAELLRIGPHDTDAGERSLRTVGERGSE
jgi:hypothetical protein